MKKGFIIMSVVFVCSFANAQQVGVFNHYFYKPMVYNPAFSGAGDAANAMLMSHSQWTDFKGGPQLTIFTLDGNLMDKKIGVGLSLISDRKGITNRTGGNLFYAYKLNLSKDARLAFGLSVGVTDQTIDFSKALVENNFDPTLYTDSQHKTTLNANLGIGLNFKGLEIGLSVPQIIGTKGKSRGNRDSTNLRVSYKQVAHYMLSLKYKLFIAKDKGISIAPQALIRIVPKTPFQFDGTVNFDWNDKFWIGFTYKSSYALAANVGFCLYKQLYVGYSYDFIIGNIGKYSGISHEIMVNFKIQRNKKPEPEVVKTEIPDKPVNSDYEELLDKLQNQLKKNQDKLEELSKKLEQQNTPTNQTLPVKDGKPGVQDSDGIFVTNRSFFKDSKGQVPAKGFYVMVGIFFYRDFANEEVKNYVKKGFKNSDWLFCESTKNNYVFALKVNTKEEAFEKVKDVTSAGGSNVWILKLLE